MATTTTTTTISELTVTDVALVKSGKFKDCVLSWMFGRKELLRVPRVQVLESASCLFFVSCAHVPCCVNGQCYGGVLVPGLSVSEMYAQLARCGLSEFRGFAPILSSVAHHVEYVNLCKNVLGDFASLLLRVVSELQVSRRCWGLVAIDAWCVRIARMVAVLFGAWEVIEQSWGWSANRSHVSVPDFDYATRNGKLVTSMRTCLSASGVVSISRWLDCGAVTRGYA